MTTTQKNLPSVCGFFFVICIQKVTNCYLELECPIFLKGEDHFKTEKFERGPGIFINQKTGTVYAYFSKESLPKGEFARTLGYVKPNKWTQITAMFTESAIKIYLNGVLDGFASVGSGGGYLRNKQPIYIGGHPNYLKACSIEMTIDSLKMYNRELHVYEIQAGVRTSLGIIEPSYFHLSCFDCYYGAAKTGCVTNYQLCSAEDLYSGVWQAAYIMGWVTFYHRDRQRLLHFHRWNRKL
jgi:hypothetical protein